MMIYLQLIFDMIKENLVDFGIAIVGLVATLSMFIPEDSILGKFFGIFGSILNFIKGLFGRKK
tara:strand:+ start:2088 stop:2276 length:189 start_codon:yes stop_codon:yes gene_type:complete